MPPATGATQFASGVNLVDVYATVADRNGEPIRGLTAADFTVRDDGAAQPIVAFAAGDFPLAVALAVDRSFSMAGDRLATAKLAGRVFLNALRPDDETMIVAIGSETETVAPLTRDRRAADAALQQLDAWGTTSLYDAVLGAIDAIQAAQGRRALIVLSDGADRGSAVSAGELVDRARRHDVLVYPIALGRTQPPVFGELAAATGGRTYHVPDSRRLETTLTAIARELRTQYLLGYAPPDAPGPPHWHAIDVTVNRPGARVRAREGYVSR